MSKSDNPSHKEKKTDPSAMKKQSEKVEEKLVSDLADLKIKESTPPSDSKEIKVKFLINVPVGVTPEMSERPESHCQKFLDLLRRTAFKPEDEGRYNDIAVVFGINGKESDRGAIDTEFAKPIEFDKIAFEKFSFQWPDNDKIPYRFIRESIKTHKRSRDFVKQFRTERCKIYFCFFDADTVDFNHVLSSYIDIIHEHEYPTVMSTGYVFPKNSENRENSERDLEVRIKTAEHFPLGTYYPEANFCVLLPDREDTLPEKFDYPRDVNNDMESPNLITQVKTREGFNAVFADKNPIVTSQINGQFHTNPRTWAISAYAHRELKVTEGYKQETYGQAYVEDKRVANNEHIHLLRELLRNNIDINEHRTHFEGPGTDPVFKAARAGVID